jgi:hypothetical protein
VYAVLLNDYLQVVHVQLSSPLSLDRRLSAPVLIEGRDLLTCELRASPELISRRAFYVTVFSGTDYKNLRSLSFRLLDFSAIFIEIEERV